MGRASGAGLTSGARTVTRVQYTESSPEREEGVLSAGRAWRAKLCVLRSSAADSEPELRDDPDTRGSPDAYFHAPQLSCGSGGDPPSGMAAPIAMAAPSHRCRRDETRPLRPLGGVLRVRGPTGRGQRWRAQ